MGTNLGELVHPVQPRPRRRLGDLRSEAPEGDRSLTIDKTEHGMTPEVDTFLAHVSQQREQELMERRR